MHCCLLRNISLMDGGKLRLPGDEAGQVVVHQGSLGRACRKGRRRNGRS